MNRILKSLVVQAKATLLSIIILIILTIVFFFSVEPVIDILFPPTPPPTGISIFGPNIQITLNTLAILYFLSVCFASSISGFLMGRWGRETGMYAWQSFISGFIIGILGPLLFFLVEEVRVFLIAFISQRILFFTNESITVLIFSLFSGLIGVLGYYMASRKYRQQIAE